jgi:hypothetical protein
LKKLTSPSRPEYSCDLGKVLYSQGGWVWLTWRSLWSIPEITWWNVLELEILYHLFHP